MLLCSPGAAGAQTPGAAFEESFDSVVPPQLPPGWVSSRNRGGATDDFLSASTAFRSPPNALVCTNATIEQWVLTPLIGCANCAPKRLSFYSRRSSSFRARVMVEASLDSGATFSLPLGEAPASDGGSSYQNVSFDAPAALAGASAIIIRWKVLPDTAGASGTFRLDDITLEAGVATDVGLSSLRLQPPNPAETDSVLLTAVISNAGELPVSEFTLELFDDADHDSLAEGSELLAAAGSSSALPPLDSVTLVFSLGRLAPGRHDFIGVLRGAGDQNAGNDQGRTGVQVSWKAGSIVINELMYAPGPGEPEWIELFNRRSEAVPLQRWAVTDAAVETPHLIPPGCPPVPPGGYLILASDSAAFAQVHQPLTCPVVDVPGFPSLNNTGDLVVLLDMQKNVQDSVRYVPFWGGSSGGVSLERVDEEARSEAPANWKTCRDPAGSTPGAPNSVRRKASDLEVAGLRSDPPEVLTGDTVRLAATVRNAGRLAAAGFSVAYYWDTDRDSLAEGDEVVAATSVSGVLAPGDEADARAAVRVTAAGRHIYMAKLASVDEDSTNDIAFALVSAARRGTSVCINEVQYAPPAGMPEWVELLNISAEAVDLSQWKVGNAGPIRHALSETPVIIAPSGFIVLTKDSALLRSSAPVDHAALVQVAELPTFCWNNSGDAVVLLDETGRVADSLRYRAMWGGTGGSSLERIDPLAPAGDSANWGSCCDPLRSTPGKINSIARRDLDLCVDACRLVPDPDEMRLDVIVRNVGRLPAGPFRLHLFRDADGDSSADAGELVEASALQAIIPPGDSLTVSVRWPASPCGRANIIVKAEYPEDERTANNSLFSIVAVQCPERTLVVNEIMSAPLPEQAEYVEFFNPSPQPVNLSGWTLRLRKTAGESTTHSVIADSTVLLPGNGYAVVAGDSSIFRGFPDLPGGAASRLVVVRSGKLSLANEGGDVVLLDPSGILVDSVTYLPSWHNPEYTDVRGRSLERIMTTGGSCDPRNWSTCVLPRGGTPGFRNSIAASPPPPGPRLSFFPNPFSPDGDGWEDALVIHYELRIPTPLISIKIFDVRGRLIRRLVDNEPSSGRGEAIWDGLDDQRRKARIGIYIVLIEAINAEGGTLETRKGAVVVGGKL